MIRPSDARSLRRRLLLPAALLASLSLAWPAGARLDTPRYGQLREAERYQMDLAEKLAAARKWESAQAEFEKFIALYLPSAGAPYAQYMIASCCEKQNLINQAIKEYKAVLAYFPQAPEAPLAAFAIGRCCAATGEMELAVQQYTRVIAQYPKDPIAGDALWEASEIQISRRLYDKALDLRRRLVDSSPQCAHFPHAVDWLVDHYLFTANDPDAARAACRLRRSPVETERYLAGRLFDSASALCRTPEKKADGQKRMDQAIGLLNGLITQFSADKPRVKDALALIAQCYRNSVRPDKALEAFERALKEFPDDDDLRQQFGGCLEENNRWPEARLQYLRFKDRARGAYQVAESYYRQRKPAEAEAAYLRIVAEYPDQSKLCLFRVGDLHQRLTHNFDKAINAFRQSEYNPPEYLFRIGECFDAWKKYDMAIRTYEEISGFFKDHAPQALWRIGLCYEKRRQDGDTESAIASFKRILDRYPASSESSQARQRLEDKYKISYTGGGMKKEKD